MNSSTQKQDSRPNSHLSSLIRSPDGGYGYMTHHRERAVVHQRCIQQPQGGGKGAEPCRTRAAATLAKNGGSTDIGSLYYVLGTQVSPTGAPLNPTAICA